MRSHALAALRHLTQLLGFIYLFIYFDILCFQVLEGVLFKCTFKFSGRLVL